jgi:1,2-diacylglycerol 3-alpha-glucosyltransferase
MVKPMEHTLQLTSTRPVRSLRPVPLPAASWPGHIGLMNDYVRIPYANGSSFASQFLYREFVARGHRVSVVGPRDPSACPADLPSRCVSLASSPLRNHPGVQVPLPSLRGLREVADQRFDVLLGQTGSELIELGVWLRAARAVPFLAVNTIHLPSVYNTVLPDVLNETPAVRALFERGVVPWLEQHSVRVYNQGDGLIVLSEGMARYWRSRGVSVPIYVIPRAVEPMFFDASASHDPFDPRAKRGQRLLCVCRHAREKNLIRLLEIFAGWIAPAARDSTLTLVGDGPDHEAIRAAAVRLGVGDRVFFPGEFPVTETVDFYRHADLFVYASLSETYGQVVSEALWCGLPVVALADQMGVSDQVQSGQDGVLITSDASDERVNWRFGNEVVALLRHPEIRRCYGAQGAKNARLRSDASRCIQRYYDAFTRARTHCAETWRPTSLREQLQPLVRWAAIHGGLLGLGLLRAPALLNRHGRRQPTWHGFAPSAARRG